MHQSGILTDNACQFLQPNFPGSQLIQFLNYQVDLGTGVSEDIHTTKLSDYPKWVEINTPPNILPIDFTSVTRQITELTNMLDDLFIILISRELHSAFDEVERVIKKLNGRAKIHLVDSQTISIGEGSLVQLTAGMIAQGISASLIVEIIRRSVPHCYTLLSTPNLSYLHKNGYLDAGQATAGEIMSLSPIFSLEAGKLNPLEKMKNVHAIVEYFIEFIDEFHEPERVSFIHPNAPLVCESKLLKQHVEESTPSTKYSEFTINPFLATLIGPSGIGLVINDRVPL